MIARIGSELRRGTSIDTQIGAAITTAITKFQAERLFQKDETNTFSTVASQATYSSADASWLGRVSRLDYVHLLINGISFPLTWRADDWLDVASVSAYSGQPYHYGWFAEALKLYPPPSQVWTVRVAGNFEEAAPATDAETGNTWMTTAEDLIRCQAKYELYTHVLANPQRAAMFDPDNPASPTAKALRALQKRTTAKMATGYVMPWCM